MFNEANEKNFLPWGIKSQKGLLALGDSIQCTAYIGRESSEIKLKVQ